MSHEIRTPMNGIVGFTKLLSNTTQSIEQKKYTALIEASTKTLTGIVNDILDYSKIENKKLHLDPIDINIFLELNSMFSQFGVTAEEKDIKLCMFIDPQIKESLVIDALRLRQILSNLISNALKFTYREGKVHLHVGLVKTSKNSQKILFKVIDTGIGMDKQQQKNIFVAFEQADISTTRKFGGTGLGLSISSSLVKLMNSSLEIKSEPNRGSTFSFEIEVPFNDSKEKLEEKLKDCKIALIQADEHLEHIQAQNQLDVFNVKYDIFSKNAPLDYTLYICFDVFVAQDLVEKVDLNKQEIILLYPIDNIVENTYGITHYKESPSSLYKLLYNIKDLKKERKFGECAEIDLLVAEDYELNRILISEMLEKCNIIPDFAKNGQEAIEMARSKKYDLILMDINMPIISGIDATRVIRLKDKKTPIVAFSANVMEEDQKNYINSGMEGFLPKPIDANELYKTIHKYAKSTIKIKITEEKNSITNTVCLQEAIDALGLPEDTIKMLILRFVEDSKRNLDLLFEKKPSFSEIQRCFHTIKGTAATLKLHEISIFAKDIEFEARKLKDICYIKRKDEILKLFKICEEFVK